MAIWKRVQKPVSTSSDALKCSFCRKSQRDVQKLIAGPSVYICDECVEICNQILAENILLKEGPQEPKDSERAVAAAPVQLTASRCSLCHLQFASDQLVLVPERGAICLACGDVVRARFEEAHSTQ